MAGESVTLFYREGLKDDYERVRGVIFDNNLYLGSRVAAGFSVTINKDLCENLESLFGEGMEVYPDSVLTSDKISSWMVKGVVRKNGGFFARLVEEDGFTCMREIKYGIQRSDFYRFLELVGCGCKAVGA
jgi:hypothetical protein